MSIASALSRRGKNPIPGHTVGNALVLYGRPKISTQAQSLAMAVAKDPEHDVVVLDMPERMSMNTWESVASALPRRRRTGIRLVICGEHAEPASLVGQWLSERLNRPVVAPHGTLTRSAAGSLFVHSGPGTGWIRYRPGREPKWEGKRFPRPVWDHTVAEDAPTSSTGVAEPVPGGVWIHDSTDEQTVAPHRDWLLAMVPCQPDDIVVLLGCPGTRPLPLDDVFRFYRKLDAETRERVRFVGFGPVDVPGVDPLGQALADALATPVICYTGVPIGSPAQPQMFTVDTEGRLCWQAFAEELAYAPRERPAAPPRTPDVLSHRTPMELGEQLEPGVYWYADDAVIEVLQSGLWVRPSDVPRDADLIRAAHADPERHTLVYDDVNDHRAARMRTLAEDVAGQLDPATRARTELLPASALVAAAARGPASAGGALATGGTAGGSAAGVPARSGASALPAPPPATAVTTGGEVGWQEPVAAPAPAIEAPAASQPPAAVQVPVAETAAPQLPTPAQMTSPAAPPVAPPAVSPPTPSVLPHSTAAPAVASPTPPAASSAAPPVAPSALSSIAAPSLSPAPPAATPPMPAPPAAAPSAATPLVSAPSGSVSGGQREAKHRRPAAPPQSGGPERLQPVPDRAASALPPGRGLAEERAWLRKSLSRDYDAVATVVSRVLSEQPGLQGGNGLSADDVMTDSVAVRLYLSQQGRAIDAGLRSARKGPHVPFARCAVSGLSRLPSHRGATVYAASPTRGQWKLLAGRTMLTEWGFLNALAAPSPDLDGDTDVLIWSMTARRARLLEPDGDEHADNRLLYLPGTSFKVLSLTEPAGGGRGELLLREVNANEINPDGKVQSNWASLDELAVTSLRRCMERWAETEPSNRVGPAARSRFGALPGLAEREDDR